METKGQTVLFGASAGFSKAGPIQRQPCLLLSLNMNFSQIPSKETY